MKRFSHSLTHDSQMMGLFAEFERALIRERVKGGLEHARAQEKKLRRCRATLPERREPPIPAPPNSLRR